MSQFLDAIEAGNWTNTSQFNCVGIHRLPFHGLEVLFVTLLYLSIVTLYCVTLIDVALKQMWPEKLLDSEVMKRVKKLQEDFPGLGQKGGGTILAAAAAATATADSNNETEEIKFKEQEQQLVEIKYDKIVCQGPYIQTCCVDEDLTFVLANKYAYGSVSSYCTSTARGFAMLSTMLVTTGSSLGFLWLHNAMIYPINSTNSARYNYLAGYTLVFLTGVVMSFPTSNAVHRNRNILLWDSIPTSSPVMFLHSFGFGSFLIAPLVGSLLQLWFTPPNQLPDREVIYVGTQLQVLGVLAFILPKTLFKKGYLPSLVVANQISILGECFLFVVSALLFVQVETFSTAACGQVVTTFGGSIIGVMAAVASILVVKHYAGAPTGPYTNNPSVLLTYQGQPVATSGPVPVLNYDREAAILPIVQPHQ